jgi:D-glycero-alpha-D-manno-heptose 1-phosphate guanylyltransferase
MEAVILAGGLGTRLRAVVPDLPKPMAPVGARPFLEIILTNLAQKGFGRVVLSLGHLAEKVVTYFGDSFANMSLVYEIETNPLGTGGALRRALTRCESDHMFVFNGDTFLDLEISKLEARWQANHLPIIVGKNVVDTTRFGRLETVAKRVVGFKDRNTSGAGLVNAGCYVVPAHLLDGFELNQAFSFETDFLGPAVRSQRFDLFITNGLFIDIGVPEDYRRAQTELNEIFS